MFSVPTIYFSATGPLSASIIAAPALECLGLKAWGRMVRDQGERLYETELQDLANAAQLDLSGLLMDQQASTATDNPNRPLDPNAQAAFTRWGPAQRKLRFRRKPAAATSVPSSSSSSSNNSNQ